MLSNPLDSHASGTSSSSSRASTTQRFVTGVPVCGPYPLPNHSQYAVQLLRYEELNATIANLQAQNVRSMSMACLTLPQGALTCCMYMYGCEPAQIA